MEIKQLNARIPLFVHAEFGELKIALRERGTKPTDGDLVAALIHRAVGAVEETQVSVEQFIKDELAEEGRAE